MLVTFGAAVLLAGVIALLPIRAFVSDAQTPMHDQMSCSS
jgi:hypothetical protein